jgi:ABC-2 type transport system permease protein
VRRIWLVAAREYVENVKTKAFLIGIFLTPAIMGGAIAISKLTKHSGQKDVTLALLDPSGEILPGLLERIEAHNGQIVARPRYEAEVVEASPEDVDRKKEELARRTRDKELFGFVVLSGDLVEGEGRAEYHTANPTEDRVLTQVRGFVEAAVREARLDHFGVKSDVVEKIQRSVPLDEFDVTKKPGEQRESRKAALFTAIAFTMLLFIGILGYAQWLLTTLIEEKSNRIVEVVLSSVSPFQLMAGKILGMGLVSLTLLSLWSGGGYVAAATQGMTRAVPLVNVGYFLAYFLLGFFLFAALFSAIGAACNTLKEAQNMQGPVTMVLIVPMLFLEPILRNPDGTIAFSMSWVPFFAPFVMMMRLAVPPGPEAWEIPATLLWLALWVFVVMWAAGRVFRVGILMYGKPPRPRELLRWMTTK